MKADLYVQGQFWATIVIPGDSLLALLAKGMIAEATAKARVLTQDIANLDQAQVSIGVRLRHPLSHDATLGD